MGKKRPRASRQKQHQPGVLQHNRLPWEELPTEHTRAECGHPWQNWAGYERRGEQKGLHGVHSNTEQHRKNPNGQQTGRALRASKNHTSRINESRIVPFDSISFVEKQAISDKLESSTKYKLAATANDSRGESAAHIRIQPSNIVTIATLTVIKNNFTGRKLPPKPQFTKLTHSNKPNSTAK